MLCTQCITAWQQRQVQTSEQISIAITVYDGKALCMSHFNAARGWPAEPNWREEEEE